MKKLALLVLALPVMFASVSCGPDEADKNAASNSSTNCPAGTEWASVNGIDRCYTSCVQDSECDGDLTCTNGLCLDAEDDDGGTVIVTPDPTDNNTTGTTNNSEPKDSCSTAADCGRSQECKSGFCEDHLECFLGVGSTGCNGVWEGCGGKDYKAECALAATGYTCSCIVNDVEVGSFNLSDAEYQSCEDAPHRVFNENCDWLVPNATF